MQGVTELVACKRCDDEWLREVQSEFRDGRLSEETHKLLHGKQTMFPGSCVNGTPFVWQTSL